MCHPVRVKRLLLSKLDFLTFFFVLGLWGKIP